MAVRSYLAYDMGATNCKSLVGQFDGERIVLRDVHRFVNTPVWLRQRYCWDFPRLLHEIKQAMIQAERDCGRIESFGLETWGCSFGLLSRDGNLVTVPSHYMDPYFTGAADAAFAMVPRQELFEALGSEMTDRLTLFQLLWTRLNAPEVLGCCHKLLMTPDLLRYFLTGEIAGEKTIMSTGGLLSPVDSKLPALTIERLGLPRDLFPPIISSGTPCGRLSGFVAEELGVSRCQAVAVAGHDTASAVFGMLPDSKGERAFLSCGTWSLLGILSSTFCTTPAALEQLYCNELSADGKIRIIRNICGLWIYQQCFRQWRTVDQALDYRHLDEAAAGSAPFAHYIDVEHPSFLAPNDMERTISQYCLDTGQSAPQTRGAVIRCILESLAMKYRQVVDGLEKLLHKPIDALQMTGGGTKDKLLLSCTANAIGRPVYTGLSDAAALGNVALQLAAAGEVGSIEQAQEVMKNSYVTEITPPDPAVRDRWEEEYTRYLGITGRSIQRNSHPELP